MHTATPRPARVLIISGILLLAAWALLLLRQRELPVSGSIHSQYSVPAPRADAANPIVSENGHSGYSSGFREDVDEGLLAPSSVVICVVSEDGLPIHGAEIIRSSTFARSFTLASRTVLAVTDAAGIARLPERLASDVGAVVVHASGYAAAMIGPVRGGTRYTVSMAAERSITIRITDGLQVPVANAWVYLSKVAFPSALADERQTLIGIGERGVHAGGTDSSGSVRFGALSRGNYALRVACTGYLVAQSGVPEQVDPDVSQVVGVTMGRLVAASWTVGHLSRSPWHLGATVRLEQFCEPQSAGELSVVQGQLASKFPDCDTAVLLAKSDTKGLMLPIEVYTGRLGWHASEVQLSSLQLESISVQVVDSQVSDCMVGRRFRIVEPDRGEVALRRIELQSTLDPRVRTPVIPGTITRIWPGVYRCTSYDKIVEEALPAESIVIGSEQEEKDEFVRLRYPLHHCRIRVIAHDGQELSSVLLDVMPSYHKWKSVILESRGSHECWLPEGRIAIKAKAWGWGQIDSVVDVVAGERDVHECVLEFKDW